MKKKLSPYFVKPYEVIEPGKPKGNENRSKSNRVFT